LAALFHDYLPGLPDQQILPGDVARQNSSSMVALALI
jgi:hypothetical protein